MERLMVVAFLLSACGAPSDPDSADRGVEKNNMREASIPAGNAALYSRDLGDGLPVIVLHGGPDFDHSYLRPDLDRLSDSLRLIYYDQRGRGRSAAGVRAEDVTLESEIADLETVRRHYQLGATAVLGPSWGAVLALEYAIRHPDRVSHLLLMNPAPASAADLTFFRERRLNKTAPDRERMTVIAAIAATRRATPTPSPRTTGFTSLRRSGSRSTSTK